MKAEDRNYSAWIESNIGDSEKDFNTESAQMNPDVLSDQESFYAILAGTPNESEQAATARKTLKSWHSILSGQQREVFRLHFLQGLSFQDIGEKLGIREDTVRDYWDGARNNLKKYFPD
jgi:RNA polymerase sigma factor (sigma-70 family)